MVNDGREGYRDDDVQGDTVEVLVVGPEPRSAPVFSAFLPIIKHFIEAR